MADFSDFGVKLFRLKNHNSTFYGSKWLKTVSNDGLEKCLSNEI